MENSFELVGEAPENERREPPGLISRFLRGPGRGSPQLDGSFSSTVLLCLEVLWILLLTIPAIAKTLYRAFVDIRETKLKNKVVVITGAGNGLGKEMALQMAREGCRIACVDIQEKKNKETETAIACLTGRKEDVRSYRCDVSNLAEVEKLAEDIVRDFGRVDILVSNAGILYGHPVTGGKEAIVRRVIDINLLSNFWMVRAFLPDMQRRKSGHIVFINSGSGINPIEHSSAYCASKSGLLGLAYCVDEELRKNPDWDGIRVTSACPYFIATNPEYVRCWSLRMAPIPVSYAASEIITGIKRRYFLFHVPSIRVGYFLTSLFRMMPREIYNMYKNVFYVDVALEEKSA
ncbi:UNVERIFIED_CONTAM: hypothetical protein PYX00_005454 [Menopon gallinae]|uniref:Uncharacterized protein n=1 Tax=Menopon gallinae TaxID=328185 RepID=A0AAW2HSF3_9NEOP